MELSINSTIKLNNDVKIPVLGLGTWQIKGKDVINAVLWALEAGYRHIDTAKLYGNEKEIGIAIKESDIPRKELFITTKLWDSDQGFDKAYAAFNNSLRKLDLSFVDLYLIHWPRKLRNETWKALEKIYDEGKARAIGVSNFAIHHLEELLINTEIVPAVNQVEFSPFLYQKDLLEYCKEHEIQLEAYSPLTKGRKITDSRLADVSAKYSKTPAQILIRWVLQHEVIVIPKSSNKARIVENANVFDFSISEENMEFLNSFGDRFVSSWDPTNTP